MSRPDFLQPLRDAACIVRQADIRLQELAGALELTGNNRLAQRLQFLSQDLDKAWEFIEAGATAALDTVISDSNAASHNMVRAALAVAEMQSKLPPQDGERG